MKIDSQISFDFTGSQLRDVGIELATDHAESKSSGWKERTWLLFKDFLKGKNEPFMLEEFRSWLAVEKPDYDWPPVNMAFGFLPLKAAKEKIIIKTGYGKVSNKNAHATPASIWKRI